MAEKVRDLMTQNLRTLSADGTADEAARAMRDADVGDVLVLDAQGMLCGIVTDRDITIRLVAEGRDPSNVKIDDICSHELLSIDPETDAEEAAQLMRQRAVRRLPVTEDGRPVGVVSIGDLAVERDPDSALADISAARANE